MMVHLSCDGQSIVSRVHDGSFMGPSVFAAEGFSAEFSGDVPANINPISRKCYY